MIYTRQLSNTRYTYNIYTRTYINIRSTVTYIKNLFIYITYLTYKQWLNSLFYIFLSRGQTWMHMVEATSEDGSLCTPKSMRQRYYQHPLWYCWQWCPMCFIQQLSRPRVNWGTYLLELAHCWTNCLWRRQSPTAQGVESTSKDKEPQSARTVPLSVWGTEPRMYQPVGWVEGDRSHDHRHRSPMI